MIELGKHLNNILLKVKRFFDSRAISFALPITLDENISTLEWRKSVSCYTERRFVLLVKSFLKYFDANDLGEFLIICPARDISRLTLLLQNLTNDARFIVVDEKKICPDLDKLPDYFAGWYIQQILKIAVAKHINTKFYLTLDSDVICKKHFNASMLIVNGKAYTNIETRSDFDEIYSEKFSKTEWEVKSRRITASAKLLNYERKIQYLNNSYGETPVLLHTKSIIGMTNQLSKQYGNWVQALSKSKNWTEYTLYFLYMEKRNILQKHHTLTGRNTVLDLDASVWHTPEKYTSNKVFCPEHILKHRHQHGYFVAVQSYLDPSKWLPDDFKSIDAFYEAISYAIFENNKNHIAPLTLRI